MLMDTLICFLEPVRWFSVNAKLASNTHRMTVASETGFLHY